ncbi:uncharacterized protein LOC144551053 [Carex rostrata]
MATATPLSLLRLPPLCPPPRPYHSIPILKLRWKSTTLPQRTPIRAATGEIAPSQVPLERAQEIVPAASDDGIVSTIISSLLVIAFVVLCVLTIGVIYLGVEDFLQKRAREKFEKEEVEKKKKDKKKGKKRIFPGSRRVGLSGFEDDDSL